MIYTITCRSADDPKKDYHGVVGSITLKEHGPIFEAFDWVAKVGDKLEITLGIIHYSVECSYNDIPKQNASR